MRYQVTAPLPGFQGTVVGVRFQDGHAEIDTASPGGLAAHGFFQRHHYGLTPIEDESVPEPQQEDVPPAAYDPGAHTVEEVLAHLADADPEETARVLAAEQAGKARAGILNKTTPPAPTGDDQKGADQ